MSHFRKIVIAVTLSIAILLGYLIVHIVFYKIDSFDEFVADLDINEDGGLTISEFLSQKLSDDLKNLVNRKDRIDQFYHLDLNCDGKLTAVEMREVSNLMQSDSEFLNRKVCNYGITELQ